MRGKAYRSRLLSHSCACSGERQPGRSWFQTCRAAPAKVGVDSARCFSARRSPPSRASFRFANAFARASFSETRGYPPSPNSVRRPRIVRRWIQPGYRGPHIEIEAVAVAIAPGLAHVLDVSLRNVTHLLYTIYEFVGGVLSSILSTVPKWIPLALPGRERTGAPESPAGRADLHDPAATGDKSASSLLAQRSGGDWRIGFRR